MITKIKSQGWNFYINVH